MTADEAALLYAMLAFDFLGAAELREQMRSLLVSPGCRCGCGTINLHPVGENLPPSPISGRPLGVGGDIFDDRGEYLGGVMLFVEAGLLDRLEVFTHLDPLPLPTVDQVEWHPWPAMANPVQAPVSNPKPGPFRIIARRCTRRSP